MGRFPGIMCQKSLFLVIFQLLLPVVKKKIITYVPILMIKIFLEIKIF